MPTSFLTGAQLRAARALLNWTVRDLADRAQVHRNTISAFESEKTFPNTSTLAALVRPLEQAGIVFMEDNAPSPSGGAGVRFKAKPAGWLRPEELSAENDG
ncbi:MULTISPECIES: helix-turn-helix transcriptional regulator [unclassified Chelatococcus]|uniref:helix-turn-helix transcriptional regulator n=1 Tax=unclassified Chelatococcus TaxID=2638111 RepID=UPI0020C118F9|nr:MULTISPECIES: helix-turn-helix transcriptional regulator [unclassified Chelatococcus]MCO5075827.1 helix-turn-helix domain-containing protein [Chelatococcus sp.]CAH1649697.1 Helix-turn-helix protein [Hyphomicrobiales bacterium]CAH1667042.1 Helix-turn-helix protein [Hyphomicrobiales bacterium]